MIVNLIIFILLGVFIIASSILAVTAKRMMRAATFLLFVLIGTAGLYLFLNYHFLAAVQLAVYAGGVLVLFIFAILLTSDKGDKTEPEDKKRVLSGLLTVLAGLAVTLFIICKHKFLFPDNNVVAGDEQISMKVVGHALMGTEKYQYLLPFEALSILLLACIIGGILIARKR
jgi:NADH-quinone oxidoreductase subunit J